MDLVKLVTTVLALLAQLNSKRLYAGAGGVATLAYYKPDYWQYCVVAVVLGTLFALCFEHSSVPVDVTAAPKPSPCPPPPAA
jgi:hypothetical protein